MNKIKLINAIEGFVMMIVIICIGVCAVLFCKPIYRYDIEHTDLQSELDFGVYDIIMNLNEIKPREDYDQEKYMKFIQSQPMSNEQLMENYSALIDYNSIFNHDRLVFPDFPMSSNGESHFKDVKNLFSICQYIAIIGGFAGLILTIKKWISRDYIYFKYVSLVTFIVPLIVSIFAMANFNHLFIMFHKLVFNNQDWIFDWLLDPIILVLPESFFYHCLIAIIGLVWGICLIFLLVSKRLEKKWLEEVENE